MHEYYLFAPHAINLLSAISAIGYYWRGDWRHGLYWTFATGLTATITYLFKN